MAEIRKSSTSLSSQMTVLEEGQNVARPSSGGAVKRTVKKMPSEGLIVLSPEPGSVQFDSTAVRPASGGSRPGSRVGSAGRIEKKLQLARKQELSQEEPQRSSAGARLSNDSSSHSTELLSVTNLRFADEVKSESKHGPSGSKEMRKDPEGDSSDASSDSESSSAEETDEGAGASQPSHAGAPVELKGEFLKYIMDEDYGKAQELCKEILLLEPDNATCREFHSVIHEKIKQDEEEGEEEEEEEDDDDEKSDDSDDDDEEDEDDEEEGSDDEDEDSEDEEESESDDDVALPPGPINLLMGGLPVRLQQR